MISACGLLVCPGLHTASHFVVVRELRSDHSDEGNILAGGQPLFFDETQRLVPCVAGGSTFV